MRIATSCVAGLFTLALTISASGAEPPVLPVAATPGLAAAPTLAEVRNSWARDYFDPAAHIRFAFALRDAGDPQRGSYVLSAAQRLFSRAEFWPAFITVTEPGPLAATGAEDERQSRLLAAAGDEAKALAAIDRAIAAKPTDFAWLRSKAGLLEHAGREVEATALLTTFAKTHEDDPAVIVWRIEGEIAAAGRKNPDAAANARIDALVERGRKRSPNDIGLLLAAVTQAEMAGHPEQADRLMVQARALAPTDPRITEWSMRLLTSRAEKKHSQEYDPAALEQMLALAFDLYWRNPEGPAGMVPHRYGGGSLVEMALSGRGQMAFQTRSEGGATLRDLLADHDPVVVDAAVTALAQTWDPAAGPALVALLGEDDPALAGSVVATLRRHPEAVTGAMDGLLASPRTRPMALLLLPITDPDHAVARITPFLADPLARVRFFAAQALIRDGGPAGRAAVLAAQAHEPSPWWRERMDPERKRSRDGEGMPSAVVKPTAVATASTATAPAPPANHAGIGEALWKESFDLDRPDFREDFAGQSLTDGNPMEFSRGAWEDQPRAFASSWKAAEARAAKKVAAKGRKRQFLQKAQAAQAATDLTADDRVKLDRLVKMIEMETRDPDSAAAEWPLRDAAEERRQALDRLILVSGQIPEDRREAAWNALTAIGVQDQATVIPRLHSLADSQTKLELWRFTRATKVGNNDLQGGRYRSSLSGQREELGDLTRLLASGADAAQRPLVQQVCKARRRMAALYTCINYARGVQDLKPGEDYGRADFVAKPYPTLDAVVAELAKPLHFIHGTPGDLIEIPAFAAAIAKEGPTRLLTSPGAAADAPGSRFRYLPAEAECPAAQPILLDDPAHADGRWGVVIFADGRIRILEGATAQKLWAASDGVAASVPPSGVPFAAWEPILRQLDLIPVATAP